MGLTRPSAQAKALAAVTVTGAGPAQSTYSLLSTYTMHKIVTGGTTVTAVTVNLEGSLDGTNWFVLGTSSTLTAEAIFVVDKPAQYVRANLTVLTAAAAPTVTVWIAAV